ncbi:MAG: maleylpyruvate isomerase N-terminal domain-containing protein [Actinomycetota bacterium]
MIAPADPLEALRAECQRVSHVMGHLPEEAFARATRCSAWNVKELLAHMYRDMLRVLTGLSEPEPETADTDAVSYWTRYDPKDDAADIADRAKEIAAQHESGRAMAEAWDGLWQRSVSLADEADRARVVRTWGPTLTLEDLLRTRVLEITVHGTDLAAALGRPPWATEEGLAITNEILSTLLGTDLPADLAWDPVMFAEKGTGRTGLTPDEREILGDGANRFPLVS